VVFCHKGCPKVKFSFVEVNVLFPLKNWTS
jgi:hypothetical protein